MVCFVHREGGKRKIQISKRLLAGEMNVKLRKTQNSRKKLKNSRKKLKTQGKNSNFRHIHMLAMRKRWAICKPDVTMPQMTIAPLKPLLKKMKLSH